MINTKKCKCEFNFTYKDLKKPIEVICPKCKAKHKIEPNTKAKKGGNK